MQYEYFHRAYFLIIAALSEINWHIGNFYWISLGNNVIVLWKTQTSKVLSIRVSFCGDLSKLLILFHFDFKVLFNWKARGYWLKSHTHLIDLNFRCFFPVLFGCSFLDFYQNHMTFWPQTSNFSVERDFNIIHWILLKWTSLKS